MLGGIELFFLREILHQNMCSLRNKPSKDMDGAPGEHKHSAAILMLAASERLSTYNLAIVDEKLGGTLIRSADYGQQSGELLARNQAQGAAFGTREHGPVGVVFFADATGVLQHEDGAGQHLFRNPLA
jgi:hypothetical protein